MARFTPVRKDTQPSPSEHSLLFDIDPTLIRETLTGLGGNFADGPGLPPAGAAAERAGLRASELRSGAALWCALAAAARRHGRSGFHDYQEPQATGVAHLRRAAELPSNFPGFDPLYQRVGYQLFTTTGYVEIDASEPPSSKGMGDS
jgi:hypothetical protein